MRLLTESNHFLAGRLSLLIETNVNWLRQAYTLLARIDDKRYTSSPAGLEPHKAGGHMRHTLEFYDCFLDGVDGAHIDYDARRRDASIETNRAAAMSRIWATIERLERLSAMPGDHTVFVRMEDATAAVSADPYLLSSVSRELGVLSSHTTHHFALISMTLRMLGVQMDPDFGMALSTLRYRARQRQPAPAAEAV